LAVWLVVAAGFALVSDDRGLRAVLGVIAVAVLLVAVIVATATGDRDATRRRLLAIGAVGLIGLELLAYQNHVRPERFELESPAPRYVAYLRDHLHGERIMNAGRDAIYPEWGTVLEIPQIESLNLGQLPAYREFFHKYVDPAKNHPLLEIGSKDKPFRATRAALNLLSVRYIVVNDRMKQFDAGVRARYPLAFRDRDAHVSIYENRTAFPRTYLSPALTDGPPKGPAQLFSTRVTRSDDETLLAAARENGLPTAAPPGTSAGDAHVTDADNTRVEVAVEATRPAVLVLTDAYADGWSVSVNGKSQHLGPVDDVVRGVVVPAGLSTVVFTYHSRARSVGAIVSLVTIALLFGYVVVQAVRRRRKRPTSAAAAAAGVGAGSVG
jgi:hypothetical protein